MGGSKATSIVLRPQADISPDMLFLEYRPRNGACFNLLSAAKHLICCMKTTRESDRLRSRSWISAPAIVCLPDRALVQNSCLSQQTIERTSLWTRCSLSTASVLVLNTILHILAAAVPAALVSSRS